MTQFQERSGVATLGGNSITLLGPEIQVGDQSTGLLDKKFLCIFRVSVEA
jgi:hypothetical protein